MFKVCVPVVLVIIIGVVGICKLAELIEGSFINRNHENHTEPQLLEIRRRNASSQISISNESASFPAAEKACTTLFDKEYIFAFARNEEEWKQLTDYAVKNVAAGEYWIGGAYAMSTKQYYWTDLPGKEVPVYFPSFLYSYFDSYANSSQTYATTRTILVISDKSEPKISTRMSTTTRRFICRHI